MLSTISSIRLSSKRLSCSRELGASNGSSRRVCMRKKAASHPYHVQVIVGETEASEAALRRFRRLVNVSGVVPESRRRMRFESSRDRKQRKLVEKFQKRKRAFMDEIQTYEEIHGSMDPSPFQDMFGSDENMIDMDARIQGLLEAAQNGPGQLNYQHVHQQYAQ
eukprot:TRINITY_DN3649_c1_g1_i3.p1 TRINITY_DN3649_c1_g1~~TRINITY_DN3649_c1_g1_i3.p1  ORF type:complete len:164 (-),score=26.33 TRINITY_DN3649_c1_g1_i3:297-788(-)